MKKLLALAAITLTVPALAQEEEAPVTPTSVIAAASAEEWVTIAPEDLLLMELAPDARGNPRMVVIQLMPEPFSQPWVRNVRWLAREHWWDGTSVNRVQDNYVTQWGDVTEEKPLPEGMVSPTQSYSIPIPRGVDAPESGSASEYAMLDRFRPMPPDDVIEGYPAFFDGWPVAMTISRAWPIHCYSHVGVGRNYAPDTGDGSALYTIIGQPQRHMDRNLAVVGRIIEGMEHMSSLPRGSGELGFYTDDEADLRTPILSVRLASELPSPPVFEYLDTTSESFARYVEVRANRNDPFYTVPAGGIDICAVEVPVRRVAE